MTDTTTTRREAILEKIKALRAKTIANGCTEAEAMAAVRAAGELMRKYQLEESDLEDAKAERYGRSKAPAGKVTASGRVIQHETSFVWDHIAKAYGCEMFTSEGKSVLNVFGAEHNVRTVLYMVELMREASETGLKAHIAAIQYRTQVYKTIRAEFMNGFILRARQLFDEIRQKREDQERDIEYANNTQTGIIRLRGQMMKAKWDQFRQENGIQIKTSTMRRAGRKENENTRAGAARAEATVRGAAGGGVGSGARQIG